MYARHSVQMMSSGHDYGDWGAHSTRQHTAGESESSPTRQKTQYEICHKSSHDFEYLARISSAYRLCTICAE